MAVKVVKQPVGNLLCTAIALYASKHPGFNFSDVGQNVVLDSSL